MVLPNLNLVPNLNLNLVPNLSLNLAPNPDLNLNLVLNLIHPFRLRSLCGFEAGEDGQFLDGPSGLHQAVKVVWAWFARGKNGPYRLEVGKGLAERLRDAELGIPNHGTKVTGCPQKTPTRSVDFRPAWWDLVKWSRSGGKVRQDAFVCIIWLLT